MYAPPTPPTPSLSLGSLSPLSPPGPLTPPSLSMGLPGPTPYAVPYAAKNPSTGPRRVRLHTLLQFSHSPILNWDLTLQPSTISTHHRGLSRKVLAEPATSPPLGTLSVHSPYMLWSMKVSASHHGFVTVGDVLDTIYSKLRVNVAPQEFHALPSRKDAQRVTVAYEQRYRCMHSSKEHDSEKRGGVKRVDFLMGHTTFTGLSPTTRGPDVWALNTS
ncbi:hypothetical protein L208DRAFT_1396184 [Tricholoma matsutake]|nr:hypothetical protein L208DRAFT_1396184 [Tricholoma matsutake 945]